MMMMIMMIRIKDDDSGIKGGDGHDIGDSDRHSNDDVPYYYYYYY